MLRLYILISSTFKNKFCKSKGMMWIEYFTPDDAERDLKRQKFFICILQYLEMKSYVQNFPQSNIVGFHYLFAGEKWKRSISYEKRP